MVVPIWTLDCSRGVVTTFAHLAISYSEFRRKGGAKQNERRSPRRNAVRQISASSACPSVPRAFATARRRGSCIIRRLLPDFGKKAPFFVESSFDPLSASNVANVTSDHRSCLCVINIAGTFEKVNNTGLLRSTVQHAHATSPTRTLEPPKRAMGQGTSMQSKALTF